MRYEIYYVIRPNTEFASRLQSMDLDLARILKAGKMWRNIQADLSAWRMEEHKLKVKLVFLGYLRTFHGGSTDFTFIFGDKFTVSIPTFDQYWELKSYGIDDDVDLVTTDINWKLLGEIPTTGNSLVDEWISDQKQKVDSSDA